MTGLADHAAMPRAAPPNRSPLAVAKRAFMQFWYGYVRQLNVLMPTTTLAGIPAAVNVGWTTYADDIEYRSAVGAQVLQ